MSLPGPEVGGEGLVRVIACIVAWPLEQPAGVGFSRQTLPGDFKLLVRPQTEWRDTDFGMLRQELLVSQYGDSVIECGVNLTRVVLFRQHENLPRPSCGGY